MKIMSWSVAPFASGLIARKRSRLVQSVQPAIPGIGRPGFDRPRTRVAGAAGERATTESSWTRTVQIGIPGSGQREAARVGIGPVPVGSHPGPVVENSKSRGPQAWALAGPAARAKERRAAAQRTKCFDIVRLLEPGW